MKGKFRRGVLNLGLRLGAWANLDRTHNVINYS
jgi:hypothetical protein